MSDILQFVFGALVFFGGLVFGYSLPKNVEWVEDETEDA